MSTANRLSAKKLRSEQSGFTIVEFMIAAAVFSMVILVCAFAIVHVGRMYYKGVITNRTQDAARRVVEDIAAAIQFGPRYSDPNLFFRTSDLSNDPKSICIGNNRYTFTSESPQGNGAGMSPHVLWKDRVNGTNCPVGDLSSPSNGMEMLGNNMRLPLFSVTPPTSGLLWNIQIRVAYGDNVDLFEGNGTETNPEDRFRFCKGVIAGGQFCAISGFETSVVKRL